MELRPDKFRKCRLRRGVEDRRLIIKKHFTEKKNKKSSSSKESDKPSEENSDDTRPPSRSSSPDPNCPICLEPLANKSFTDSCFHTFCFTCLLEWSKVKPECPLCKQQFKCIVHNVQSDFSYDEYHINTTHSLWTICQEQRFRYPTTLTTRFQRRNIESYQDTYHNQIESHRMRYAPHAVRLLSSSQNMSRTPCNFRIRVYTQGLWVLPVIGSRIRMVSPEFYRRNPACTHRLLPWLNRELVAILQNNETQVTFVIELIMALIARYEINSQEFFIHVEPYLGDKTRHFIHELYNFAISPHDLETYDRQASYSGPTDDQHLDLDNEVRIVDEAFERTSTTSTSRSAAPASSNTIKLVVKKTAQKGWHSELKNALNLSNPGPSTSATTIRYRDISGELSRPSSPPATSSALTFSSPIHVTSSTDSEGDECQVVDVLKPKSERTPEIVDLSSDEEVLQTLINVSSGSAISSPVYSPGSPSYELSPASSDHGSPFDWNIHTINTTRNITEGSPSPWTFRPPIIPFRRPSTNVSNRHDDSSSDLECIFNSNQLDSVRPDSDCSPPRNESSASLPYRMEDSNARSSSSNNDNKEIVQDLSVPKKKLPSAIVRPWAMNEASKEASTSKPSKKKRRASSMHSNDAAASSQHASLSYMSDATTSEYSDNASTDDKPSSSKKLKLRSVVAHFSFDSSEKSKDSSHRSSHKKHKDKRKKKKKKHVHKRKHRVPSDSDSS